VEPRFLRPIFGVTFQPICNWRAPQVQSYLNFTETRQMPRRYVTRFVLVFSPSLFWSHSPFTRRQPQSRRVSTSSAQKYHTMGFGESPKSPSFEKDRRGGRLRSSSLCTVISLGNPGWNSAWERDLATIYGPGLEISSASRRPVPSIIADMPTQYYEMMLGDAPVSSLKLMTSQICILQRDLTRKSSKRFAEDDFESHWTTRCSVKEREDFILEGLVRACEASPDFEDHRKW
jgi:hypothetical protein